MLEKQARQESNLQPPILEPTPSSTGVAPFADSQRLSFSPPTRALLDTAGVGTNSVTVKVGGSSFQVLTYPERWPRAKL
jgi:hypothetical protein